MLAPYKEVDEDTQRKYDARVQSSCVGMNKEVLYYLEAIHFREI